MTVKTLTTSAALLAVSAVAANAHPGDHAGMAAAEALHHVASSPVHVPALLLAGAALAGGFFWLRSTRRAKQRSAR